MKRPKILFLVCSNNLNRAKECYDTWGKKTVDLGEFWVAGNQKLATKLNYAFNAAGGRLESRQNLPSKMLNAFNLALIRDWDLIIKTDDDTFINLDSLESVIDKIDYDYDFYSGFQICANTPSEKVFYAQGGAGYILSRHTLEKILPQYAFFAKNSENGKYYAEDLMIGKSCKHFKIPLNHNESFWTPTPLDNTSSALVVSNHIFKHKLSSHYVKQDEMKKIKTSIKNFNKHKILFGIYSYSGSNDFLETCLDTWVNLIPDYCDYRIMGDESQVEKFGEKAIDCSFHGRGRGSLPRKTFNMLKSALEIPDWEYIYKCDDDVYVNIPFFLSWLSEQDLPSKNLYMGWALRWNNVVYAQGGTGYLLSRDVVEKITPYCEMNCDRGVDIANSEDVLVGKACSFHDVKFTGAGGFGCINPNANKDLLDQWILRFEKFLVHYCTKEQMRRWHRLL
jgi:hypothetical protein